MWTGSQQLMYAFTPVMQLDSIGNILKTLSFQIFLPNLWTAILNLLAIQFTLMNHNTGPMWRDGLVTLHRQYELGNASLKWIQNSKNEDIKSLTTNLKNTHWVTWLTIKSESQHHMTNNSSAAGTSERLSLMNTSWSQWPLTVASVSSPNRIFPEMQLLASPLPKNGCNINSWI